MNDLRNLLGANGLFSAANGLALLGGAAVLDEALGLDVWLLAVCGLMLVGYGASLGLAARAGDPIPAGRLASAMDVAWVVGAGAILVGFPSAMTGIGRLALLVVSVVVAGFAVLQIRAFRAATASDETFSAWHSLP